MTGQIVLNKRKISSKRAHNKNYWTSKHISKFNKALTITDKVVITSNNCVFYVISKHALFQNMPNVAIAAGVNPNNS